MEDGDPETVELASQPCHLFASESNRARATLRPSLPLDGFQKPLQQLCLPSLQQTGTSLQQLGNNRTGKMRDEDEDEEEDDDSQDHSSSNTTQTPSRLLGKLQDAEVLIIHPDMAARRDAKLTHDPFLVPIDHGSCTDKTMCPLPTPHSLNSGDIGCGPFDR